MMRGVAAGAAAAGADVRNNPHLQLPGGVLQIVTGGYSDLHQAGMLQLPARNPLQGQHWRGFKWEPIAARTRPPGRVLRNFARRSRPAAGGLRTAMWNRTESLSSATVSSKAVTFASCSEHQ